MYRFQKMNIMKRINIFIVFFFAMNLVVAQNEQEIVENQTKEAAEIASFGAAIDENSSISASQMAEKYNAMAVSDTLKAKFNAKVLEVCQSKGCWMKVQLDNNQQAMVRFKDYGFFMPKDIQGKEVVVNGLAFVEEMSVKDQKHYAKDAGKFAAEITRITTTEKTFGFEADGVLLKE